MQRAYFVVEGPHDVEAVGRILRLNGLDRVANLADLDPFWVPLVPRMFPHQGSLLKRVPVPVFFADSKHSVAVHAAGGIDKVEPLLRATLMNLVGERPDGTNLHGIGAIVDADEKHVSDRWKRICNGLSGFDVGGTPGAVGNGRPRAGVYVLPDNNQSGALEHVLLACAEKAYPRLLAAARSWIDPLEPHDTSIFVNARERQDFKKASGKTKAIVSAIASVLRPERALQVSIQDNRWLRDDAALQLEVVQHLREFVERVTGLKLSWKVKQGDATTVAP